MSKEREALKLALEALEPYEILYTHIQQAITAIKEALAQPEQELVACIGYWNQKTGAFYKPDQLSSAHQKLIEDGILRRCYINSPQSTWVGLTADELNMIGDRMRTWNSHSLADVYVAIEAKLKEKNGC